jgi:hypothetical protein
LASLLQVSDDFVRLPRGEVPAVMSLVSPLQDISRLKQGEAAPDLFYGFFEIHFLSFRP